MSTGVISSRVRAALDGTHNVIRFCVFAEARFAR